MATSQAIVPLDRDATDGIYNLASMFNKMKIDKSRDNKIEDVRDGDEDGDVYINGEKIITYMTFHKYLPDIIASLRRGDTITIMDNRMKSSNDFSAQKGENIMLPVPYKSDPLSRLCDENTVISYDSINHVIKLWDLRKNYSNYRKEPCPRSVIYLSKSDIGKSSTLRNDFKSSIDIDEIEEDVKLSKLQNNDSNKKCNLNYVLTWPEHQPSVVVTYPDVRAIEQRSSGVIIEELPVDSEEQTVDLENPPVNKGDILPVTYKPQVLKRKNAETLEDVFVPKKSIITCMTCGKPTSSVTFCDTCNWTQNKRKSDDELQHETKRVLTSSVIAHINKPSVRIETNELKGKRKHVDDPAADQVVKLKRPHVDPELVRWDEDMPGVELKPDACNFTTKREDAQICNNKLGDKLNNSKIVDLSKYMLDEMLLSSISTTETLDWKSTLRKQNCEPIATNIPKMYV